MSLQLNHSIRLYFPYTFDSSSIPSEYTKLSDGLTKLNVSDLAENLPFLNNNIHKNLLESKIWESNNYKLDKKLHSFTSKLVNGIKEAPLSNGFFGMQPLRVTKNALRVLNQGTLSELGKGLLISLKKSAMNRLMEHDISPPIENAYWPLMFNSIWFYGLNTGVGMMVVDMSFKQPGKNGLSISHLEELQEINYILCRNNNDNQSAIISSSIDSNKSNKYKIKGLSDLVDALLPVSTGTSINLKTTNDRHNTYAYTTVGTIQELEYKQRKEYLFRLVRKYNNLYLPENVEQQINYFEPFRPITHAFSLEGSASYVDYSVYNDNIPELIENFNKSVVPLAYAPLVLLTYAEYIFLREMVANPADSERVDMQNPTSENLEKLRVFKTKLYDFKLNFRYTQISANTNHNLFCKANKNALEINQLLNETSNDTNELELYIADQVSKKQEARLKKYGIMGTLFAVIISWVDLWGLNIHGILFENQDTNIYSIVIFLIVLVILVVFVILYSQDPSSDNSISNDD